MFDTLANLTKLTTKTEEHSLVEAKSTSSDFDGILSVINDCLADLEDKVAALVKLADKSGAAKLDTVKDKEGMTVFENIDKATAKYKSAMDKLMLEAELMVKQVAEE